MTDEVAGWLILVAMMVLGYGGLLCTFKDPSDRR